MKSTYTVPVAMAMAMTVEAALTLLIRVYIDIKLWVVKIRGKATKIQQKPMRWKLSIKNGKKWTKHP